MHGKTVVVTGASRGLGAVLARRFATAGARVVICARNGSEGLDEVASAIEGAGGSVTARRADVRDEFDMERLMEVAAREGSGRIDLLVTCATVSHGVPGETPLAEESYAAFDDHVRTNGRGVFAAVREAVPHLADDARVLVPSEGFARRDGAGGGSYAVSRALAEAVARRFAAELDQDVLLVDPGTATTDRSDGRSGDPDAVASLFEWAATDADPAAFDGSVVDGPAWKEATR